MGALVKGFLAYWWTNLGQSLRSAKQGHSMAVFIISAIIVGISWFWKPPPGSTALESITSWVKWCSTSGAAIWVLGHLFWVPFRRHHEQHQATQHRGQDFDIERQRLMARIAELEDQQTVLTIQWRPTAPCSDGPRCRVEVLNTNAFHAAQNIRVQLIRMEPVPRSLRNPAFPVNLPRVDENERTLNPNCSGYFELFSLKMDAESVKRQAVIKDENGAEYSFDLEDTVEQILRSFYTVTIRASAANGPNTESYFELRFPSPMRGNQAFYLEPTPAKPPL